MSLKWTASPRCTSPVSRSRPPRGPRRVRSSWSSWRSGGCRSASASTCRSAIREASKSDGFKFTATICPNLNESRTEHFASSLYFVKATDSNFYFVLWATKLHHWKWVMTRGIWQLNWKYFPTISCNQWPNSIEKKSCQKSCRDSVYSTGKSQKKWVVQTGLRINVISRQDFRQDFYLQRP